MSEVTDSERRNLEVVRDVLPSWNRHDISGVLEYYDDEITWNNVALGRTYQGKREVGGFLEEMFTAFPDLNFEVTHNIAWDDYVAEQWYIRGTHLGPFMGIPATGRSVVIPGMSMVHLRDARFLRDDFYYDAAGVLTQMGIFPPLTVGETAIGRLALWAAVNRLKVAAGIAVAGLAGLAVSRGRKLRS